MIYLNLELTDRCNLRCQMCGQAFTGTVHDDGRNDMAFDVWQTLLEGMADVPDEVSLCPHWLGEPTVHPRFTEMVHLAFRRNSGNRLFRFFKLHTNGVLLDRNDGIARLLDCAAREDQRPDTFQFVHFSLDAHDPAIYEQVKGADTGAAARANILELLRRRRQRGLTWPRVTVAFVVMPENRHDARAFLDFWSRTLEEAGGPFQVTSDWPAAGQDAIYFRRLNWDDQDAADRLHREVLAELGLPPHPGDSGDAPRSF